MEAVGEGGRGVSVSSLSSSSDGAVYLSVGTLWDSDIHTNILSGRWFLFLIGQSVTIWGETSDWTCFHKDEPGTLLGTTGNRMPAGCAFTNSPGS